jgi:RNA polymerase sigma-70 factor (ECF subfamily)
VTLAYQMGFSVEEISQITKTPTGTVKSRMFHARLRLRDIVEELGGPVL